MPAGTWRLPRRQGTEWARPLLRWTCPSWLKPLVTQRGWSHLERFLKVQRPEQRGGWVWRTCRYLSIVLSNELVRWCLVSFELPAVVLVIASWSSLSLRAVITNNYFVGHWLDPTCHPQDKMDQLYTSLSISFALHCSYFHFTFITVLIFKSYQSYLAGSLCFLRWYWMMLPVGNQNDPRCEVFGP